MNNRSAFFDALTEELPNDVWGLRLQEELAAHLDDAMYFAALEGKNETSAEEQALADLGSPNLILQEFRHAMTYKSPQAFALNAIAAGLLATPLVWLMIMTTHTAIFAIPCFGVLIGYFFIALAPMLRHIETRKMRTTLALTVAGVPTLLILIPLVISAFSTQISTSDRPFILGSFVVGALFTLLASVIASGEIARTQAQMLKDKSTKTPLRLSILQALATAAVLCGVLLIAAVQVAPSGMNGLEKLRFFFSGLVAAPVTLAAFLSPVTAVWITGIVATGAGIIALFFIGQTLVKVIKKEKTSMPWGWMLVAILTIPLITFPPTANDIQGIVWSDVPHVRISEVIERQQFGPFYGMAKYVSQSQADAFRYFVSQEETEPFGSLQVKQLPDRVFTIADLVSVNTFTLTETREDISSALMETPGIWCHWKNPTTAPFGPLDENGVETYQDGEKVYLSNTNPYCSDLWVGETLIFTVDGVLDINSSQTTLSNDGSWMLFAHDTDTQIQGELSPTEVYLIDLR